ncbi:unnamed protein product [[Candida] boidinii]|nr:unnamed protein product [[Candida] boidinii]
MTSVYKDNSTGADIIYTKGAVERVLNCCTQWKDPATGKISTLDRQAIETIEANMDSLSSKGLRVLSFAYRNPTDDEQKNIEDWSKIERSQVERDLNFVGLIGIYDPPRPETAPSVKKCHIAGINVRMPWL